MQTINDLQNKAGKMKPLQSTPIGAALFYLSINMGGWSCEEQVNREK